MNGCYRYASAKIIGFLNTCQMFKVANANLPQLKIFKTKTNNENFLKNQNNWGAQIKNSARHLTEMRQTASFGAKNGRKRDPLTKQERAPLAGRGRTWNERETLNALATIAHISRLRTPEILYSRTGLATASSCRTIFPMSQPSQLPTSKYLYFYIFRFSRRVHVWVKRTLNSSQHMCVSMYGELYKFCARKIARACVWRAKKNKRILSSSNAFRPIFTSVHKLAGVASSLAIGSPLIEYMYETWDEIQLTRFQQSPNT